MLSVTKRKRSLSCEHYHFLKICFVFIYTLIVCTERTHVPQNSCGGQRTANGNLFDASTMWCLRFELRLPGIVHDAFFLCIKGEQEVRYKEINHSALATSLPINSSVHQIRVSSYICIRRWPNRQSVEREADWSCKHMDFFLAPVTRLIPNKTRVSRLQPQQDQISFSFQLTSCSSSNVSSLGCVGKGKRKLFSSKQVSKLFPQKTCTPGYKPTSYNQCIG